MALSRFPHASAQAIAEFFAADLVEPLTLQSSGTAMSQSNGRILMCALWSRTRWRTKPASSKALKVASIPIQFPIPGRCADWKVWEVLPDELDNYMYFKDWKRWEIHEYDDGFGFFVFYLGYNDSLSECKFKSKVVAVAKWACPTINIVSN